MEVRREMQMDQTNLKSAKKFPLILFYSSFPTKCKQ